MIEFFWYNCVPATPSNRSSGLEAQAARKVPCRVPVAFSNFEPQQKLYYALEAMGKGGCPEMHGKVFTAPCRRRSTATPGKAAMSRMDDQRPLDRPSSRKCGSFGVANKGAPRGTTGAYGGGTPAHRRGRAVPPMQFHGQRASSCMLAWSTLARMVQSRTQRLKARPTSGSAAHRSHLWRAQWPGRGMSGIQCCVGLISRALEGNKQKASRFRPSIPAWRQARRTAFCATGGPGIRLIAGVGPCGRADRNKPMNIEADALRHDKTRPARFTGRVVMTTRAASCCAVPGWKCDRMRMATSPVWSRPKRGAGRSFASGAMVRLARPKNSSRARAEVIEYDGRSDSVRFVRNAELRRLRGAVVNDAITGAVIVYNNQTDVFTVDGQKAPGDGSSGGGRVRAVLSPKDAVPETAAPALPASAPGLPQHHPGVAPVSAPPRPWARTRRRRVAWRCCIWPRPSGSRKVVKDVSLVVQKGEVVGLLGPNGAGKTTSFYMIVGLVRSDGGDIRIDGQSVADMPIHRRSRLGLSYLPQEASIFRKLTVQENVRAVLELQRDGQGQPCRRPRSKSVSPLCCRSCGWSICAIRLRWPSRVASAAASRSPVPWPPSHGSSCSMSRLQGSDPIKP